MFRFMFRAVIFDLDGVLADSEPWWNEIDARLLAEYGVTYRGEYHRSVLGVSYRFAVEFCREEIQALRFHRRNDGAPRRDRSQLLWLIRSGFFHRPGKFSKSCGK